MGLRHHTIIFVPHARARFRKLRVTNRQLAVVVALSALLIVGSVVTTWSFFTQRIDHAQLDQVRDENEALRQVNRSFEETVRTLEKQLDQFETQAKELAIVAGLEAEALEGAGVGGEEIPLTWRADDLAQRFEEVEARLTERDRWLSAVPSIAPVKGVLTSGFGSRSDPFTGRPAQHAAIDISTAPGQVVRAPADGIVVEAGRDGYLGNAVTVSHGYGITTRYGHLERSVVAAGQRLRRGEPLGFVGSTGRSTGYHLHYEVFENGRRVNPLAYILDGTAPVGP